ncbi:Mn2+/Zn2+ family ABC transporter, ATP-binding protein [Crocosphaera subtropica ATCC 51142]|uniref:Mn2+/Zn2+ family ABC transporter, ATP-binding protein n=1 Tax=Crocosphaera subtropica (strain ATCC 51142 / BH68) TaxID=43989 RepID=B1WX91_CROS5|nr:metal ABC transporter ATP-binding protein [Crocosphaera subtropica]ACB50835.1 Mn2+/Zn2+ family ABC transporter, ATP-binding protein [Crocosphaera subtropica ATCC 51142]
MLEVQHLAVNYRGVVAVENISFCLQPGEIVGIIGPNGAGKSSLIKGILGLVPVDRGNVKFRSRSLSKQLAQVAYIPQRSQIDWDYPITVQNVVMMARIRHTGLFKSISRHSKLIVQKALMRVGMWELKDRPIGELSGGQQQRVFLAQALAQEAELFLFDEPFIGVDKKTEAMLFEVFDELKSSGKLLLVVGHELRETAREYDRFLLINKTLIANGSPREVITAENIQEAYGDNVIFLHRSPNNVSSGIC